MDRKIKHFIQLLKDKKEITKKAKDINEMIDWLEPEIRLHFGDHGIEKLTKDGMTIYIRRQLFAKKCDVDDLPVTEEACIQALKQAGMHNFFEQKVKMSAMSAYFKELEEEDLPLPPALEGKLKPIEVFKITGRKA